MGLGKATEPHLPIKLSRLSENIGAVRNSYPFDHHHFGFRYNKSKSYIIISENPIKEANNFFKMLTMGGSRFMIGGSAESPKIRANMGDGTIIVFRTQTSVPGSPAVTINIEGSYDKTQMGLISQKIHFIKGEQHENKHYIK